MKNRVKFGLICILGVSLAEPALAQKRDISNLRTGLSAKILPQVSPAHSYQDAMQAVAQGDYDAAFRILRPLAENGNADAQAYIGVMYANGQGAPQDSKLAMKWSRKAAAQ